MNRYSVKRRLNFDEVNWPAVLEILIKRFKLPFSAADDRLKKFMARFLRPFNLYWYLGAKLSSHDNQLLMVVCECQGADSVTLCRQKSLALGPLELHYSQEIEFEPHFRRDEAEPGRGAAVPLIEVKFLGLTARLRRFWSVLAFQAMFWSLALVLYVVGMGLLLYSVAVFLLFLHLPVPVTIAATKHASIGLALLCFLVGAAAVSGRAVKNVLGLLLPAGFKRKK